MRVHYNSPVILTYTFLAIVVLLADMITSGQFSNAYFVMRGVFDPSSLLSYIRLISHIVGHQDWSHLLSNYALILLIGPVLEEKYHSGPLLIMMLITAVSTGIIHVLLLDTGLMGASGVVFMLILLSSVTNISSGQIPLTFILVVIVYLLREILGMFSEDTISQLAHIAGGICGGIFGFLFRNRHK